MNLIVTQDGNLLTLVTSALKKKMREMIMTTNKTKNVETYEIGKIGVDSGTMMLCDPSYVMGSDTKTKEWNEVCDNLSDMKFGKYIRLNKKNFADGVMFETGFGDGSYPVTIDVVDCGKSGKRVKSATITFIDEGQKF